MSKNPKLSPQFLYLDLPLYEPVAWDESEVFEIAGALYNPGTIDVYCVVCGKDSTFTIDGRSLPSELDINQFEKRKSAMAMSGTKLHLPRIAPGSHEVVFRCARSEHHRLRYFFLVGGHISRREEKNEYVQGITKVGQHPSLADLSLPSLSKYKAVLPDKVLIVSRDVV